jgi:membrane-bound inhibitor of C-type lysozyme
MIFPAGLISLFHFVRGGPLRPLRSVVIAALLSAAACSRPLATTTFLCQGGDSIVVGFGPRHAELHLPPDRVVRLQPVQAASGARFSDGRYALHTEGGEALLERGGDVVLRGCRSAGAAPEPDTVLTPRRARAVAESINAVVGAAEPAVRTLLPEQRGWQPRVLRLWADSGRPIKLSVTEPTAAGVMDRETDYYFVGGRVEVVRGPVTQYVFRDTTLIFWTTDSLQPIADVPLRDMVARQNFVLGEIRQYLAMFGIGQE